MKNQRLLVLIFIFYLFNFLGLIQECWARARIEVSGGSGFEAVRLTTRSGDNAFIVSNSLINTNISVITGKYPFFGSGTNFMISGGFQKTRYIASLPYTVDTPQTNSLELNAGALFMFNMFNGLYMGAGFSQPTMVADDTQNTLTLENPTILNLHIGLLVRLINLPMFQVGFQGHFKYLVLGQGSGKVPRFGVSSGTKIYTSAYLEYGQIGKSMSVGLRGSFSASHIETTLTEQNQMKLKGELYFVVPLR